MGDKEDKVQKNKTGTREYWKMSKDLCIIWQLDSIREFAFMGFPQASDIYSLLLFI